MNDATKEELLEILIEKEDEIEWLKAELDEANHSRELSDAECVTLRKERDEARQVYCDEMSAITSTYVESKRKTSQQIAEEKKWSMPKNITIDQINTGMEYEDVLMRNNQYAKIIGQLINERDSARREVCNLTKWDHYGPRHYAQYRGWDCFKENTDGTK